MFTPPDQLGSHYVLTREAVRRVDALAAERFAMPSIVLMENAARALTSVALEMLRARAGNECSALIVCGSGNNGGDGFALARHLANHGVVVTVARLGMPREGSDAMTNLNICRAMQLREFAVDSIQSLAPHQRADVIVDAIFGTGLDRPVQGLARDVINWINGSRRPVLAVDLPSGLDCDTGRALDVAVKATRTVTFVAMKPCFLAAAAREFTGSVTVADIGAPIELIKQLGTPLPTS